jgi:hypothetical protein
MSWLATGDGISGSHWAEVPLGGSRYPGTGGLGRWPKQQLRHPDQVVGRGYQVSRQASPVQPPVTSPAKSTHRFHPPKDLLYSLPGPLAQGVPRVPGGPSIDGAAAARSVLGHVGVTPRCRRSVTQSRVS